MPLRRKVRHPVTASEVCSMRGDPEFGRAVQLKGQWEGQREVWHDPVSGSLAVDVLGKPSRMTGPIAVSRGAEDSQAWLAGERR